MTSTHSVLMPLSRLVAGNAPVTLDGNQQSGVNCPRYFAATAIASTGKLASSDCKVVSVEWSVTPSTRAGRK
jgi:hypothetical protein